MDFTTSTTPIDKMKLNDGLCPLNPVTPIFGYLKNIIKKKSRLDPTFPRNIYST